MNNYLCPIPSEITNFIYNYTGCFQPNNVTNVLLYLMDLKILHEKNIYERYLSMVKC